MGKFPIFHPKSVAFSEPVKSQLSMLTAGISKSISDWTEFLRKFFNQIYDCKSQVNLTQVQKFLFFFAPPFKAFTVFASLNIYGRRRKTLQNLINLYTDYKNKPKNKFIDSYAVSRDFTRQELIKSLAKQAPCLQRTYVCKRLMFRKPYFCFVLTCFQQLQPLGVCFCLYLVALTTNL